MLNRRIDGKISQNERVCILICTYLGYFTLETVDHLINLLNLYIYNIVIFSFLDFGNSTLYNIIYNILREFK